MRISAREDYAIRALIELAVADGGIVNRERISEAQGIPTPFLQNILLDLKRANLVEAHRGPEGGFRLSRPAAEISVADVIRAVSGPLATVRGVRPPGLVYTGSAETLQQLWIALRASLRNVLDHVTLADLASGKLPAPIRRLAEAPDNWE
jgi:Rrf2 family protein